MSKISLLDEITAFDEQHQAVIWKAGMVKPGRGSVNGLVAALAAPHVSQAALSAALAAASAEAAAYNRKVYASTASGLADTAPGDYFFTPGGSEDEFLIQWKHEAGGTASEIARSPSTGILSTLFSARDAANTAAANADTKAALADAKANNADAKAALAVTAASGADAAREAALNAIASLLQNPLYFQATPGQTIFELEVTPAAGVDVWRNGFRLPPSAYTLVGRFVSLSEPCDEDPADPDDIIIDIVFSRAVPTVLAANVIGLADLIAGLAEKTTVVAVTDKAFGATGLGVLDDRNAIQAAMDYLHGRGGGVLYFPPGLYRVADTSALLTMYDDIAWHGCGTRSVIFWDDRPTNPRRDMLLVNGVKNIGFKSMRFISTLDTYLVETLAGQLITGAAINHIRFEDCSFQGLRYCTLAFESVTNGEVTGCRFEDSFRDAARFIHSRDVRIIGNYFYRICDDCISFHSADANTTSPGDGLVVQGNTMVLCQGPKILGAKGLTFTGNFMSMMLRNPLLVSSELETVEGNTPQFAVIIAKNIILDTLADRGTDYAIMIQTRNRSKGALATQPGAVAPIFDYSYLNNVDAPGSVNIGAFAIQLEGNVIGRTRSVGPITGQGRGQLLDRAGTPALGYSNPVLTDASFAARGIVVDGPVRGIGLINNDLFGGSRNGTTPVPAIHMTSDADAANTIVLAGCAIRDNHVFDWIGERAFLFDHATTNGAMEMILRDNHFDLDPYHRHPAHNADGTWSSPDALIAVDFTGRLYGGAFGENHFRNCSRILPAGQQIAFGENYAYLHPVNGWTLGDNAANRGIRSVPAVPKFICIIIDGDPTSASFGKVTSIPARHAMAQPSTGTYVHGHYVQAAAPILRTVGGVNYLADGWMRNGTGAAHVAGTDWFEKLSLIGS